MTTGEGGTSTRRRILALLGAGDRTAGDLASAIGISASAVRVHLDGLSREGLIEHEPVIRGAGRPTHRYRLTRAGEGLLSRAYLPLAECLLGVLTARLDVAELDEILREAGRRLAEGQPTPGGDSGDRVRGAAALLEILGGAPEIELSHGHATLRGAACPLATLTSQYPQACAAVEAMLAEATGLPVREHCDRTGRPSCRFEITLPEAGG